MRRVLRISLLALMAVGLFRPAIAQVGIGVSISVNFAPPALPVYEQPPCPEDGFLWVPGYWAWDDDDQDYYWVPGTWVQPPEPGLLWTPAWWGWGDGGFLFHEGFWATEVGFYGGIDYGFGYFGEGFAGGRWDHDRFMYNRAVVNVDVTHIHNVYDDRTVINNVHETRVSYNGGDGGTPARPSSREEQVSHLQHFPPARPQVEHAQMARSDPQMRASANQGKPPVAATARPTEFKSGAVAARSAGAPYHPPANRTAPGGRTAAPGGNPSAPGGSNMPTHARDLPPHQAPAPTGNAKFDQQQQKLIEKQNQEHQKLQQQQEKEDQRAAQQNMNQQKRQQMEQRHAQQTQQMEQRHTQQQQRAQPRPSSHPPSRPPK